MKRQSSATPTDRNVGRAPGPSPLTGRPEAIAAIAASVVRYLGALTAAWPSYARGEMTRANHNSDGTWSGWCSGCNRQTIIIDRSGQWAGRDCDCAWLPGMEAGLCPPPPSSRSREEARTNG